MNIQDWRKPEMQSAVRPVQEQSKSQTAALEQQLIALRERLAAQSELLEERADQIPDLKEERDRWRQQATTLSIGLQPTINVNINRRRWWNFKKRNL